MSIGALLVILVGCVLWLRQPRQVTAPEQPTPTVDASRPSPTPTSVLQPTTPPIASEPTAEQPNETPVVQLASFFDDRRFTYEPNFYAPEVQAFLDSQPGTLKNLAFVVGERRHSFAEVLIGQTSYYSINPKVILALIEAQSGAVTSPNPSADQIGWAVGYRGENGNRRGLTSQVRWAVRQLLLAKLAYPNYEPLTFADNSSVPATPGMSLSEYSIARVLAPTTTPDRLPALMSRFLDTYTRLFGDPRVPPTDWPAPAEPFLYWPLEKPAQVTSFFDHGGPFLTRIFQNGVVTYWGRREVDLAIAYNGHDGWDYAVAPPDMILAAADGQVVFAGNADDGCATRSVVIDHGNGYRTLYWHLHRIDVAIGDTVARGQPIGMAGSSGCATGPHLHFGVQYLGRNVDPYGWCSPDADPWAVHGAGAESRWLWADRPSPCGELPSDVILVDTDSPDFFHEGEGWQAIPIGYGGEALFVPSTAGVEALFPWELRPLTAPAVAVWKPTLPAAGLYRVLAYVPYALSGLDDAREVRYHIRYSGGEAEIEIDAQLHANDWVDLGTYQFDPADQPTVSTSNLVEASERSVWADALIWVPVVE